jgi:putative heme-binding domain-containing protein
VYPAKDSKAQSQPQTKGTPGQQQAIASGRQIFESSCAGCHGLDGRGAERAPDISTRQQVVQLSDRELKEIIRLGRPNAGMPAFASLSDTQLDALLKYIRFLQGARAPVVLPGDASNGKQVFFGKGHCSDCHMIQGQGGFLAADLSSYAAMLSPAELRNTIVQPSENPATDKRMTNVTMRDSQMFTGIIRNEDNFSLQLISADGHFHFLAKSQIASTETHAEPLMPKNYGTILSPAELDDLVKYLATVSQNVVKKPEHVSDDEEQE